jgi:hypothetical protein
MVSLRHTAFAPKYGISRKLSVSARRFFDSRGLVLGRPAFRGAGGMGRIDRVREDHDLVRARGIPRFLVEGDKSAPLVLVEMTRNDLGRAIGKAEAGRMPRV